MFQALHLRKGNILGAILLLSGSCIGVGMLALPIITGFAGFLPTVIIFIACWLFMTTTALLFVEAYLWYPQHNILSLSKHVLGNNGKAIAFITFLFLLYSLLVAYIVKGGELVQDALPTYFPRHNGALLLTIVSAICVYFGTWISDRFNRICMLGLFITYLFLISYGMEQTNSSLLTYVNWNYSLFIIPFVVTSFGFHNMIPTISDYLNSNRKKLILTMVLGGIIPFVVYLLWVAKIQMLLLLEGPISIADSLKKGEISTQPLAKLIANPWVSLTAQYFAFFAIITSLLSQALSVVDFLADGFKIPNTKSGRLVLCLLTFLPPFIFAVTIPHVFFLALEFVGGIAAMILFGILPALIVWRGRYQLRKENRAIVPGGRVTLMVIILFASFVLGFELLKNFGWVQVAPRL